MIFKGPFQPKAFYDFGVLFTFRCAPASKALAVKNNPSDLFLAGMNSKCWVEFHSFMGSCKILWLALIDCHAFQSMIDACFRIFSIWQMLPKCSLTHQLNSRTLLLMFWQTFQNISLY